MKAHEVQALHRKLSELLALPAETEWLEFKKAARSFHFDKLGQYFSALSNDTRLKRQEVGWLIFGVQDHPRKIVGSDFRRNRADLDNLKKEIADQTSNRLTFIEIHELHLPEGRVVMFEIPPARLGEPTAWKGHYYGRDGESIGPLNPHEHELIRLLTQPDWSGEICPNASLTDLDPAAVVRARDWTALSSQFRPPVQQNSQSYLSLYARPFPFSSGNHPI